MRTNVDPVCGMEVDPARAAGMSRLNGQPVYFCSRHCHAAFDADSAKLATREVAATPPGSCCSGSSPSCCR